MPIANLDGNVIVVDSEVNAFGVFDGVERYRSEGSFHFLEREASVFCDRGVIGWKYLQVWIVLDESGGDFAFSLFGFRITRAFVIWRCRNIPARFLRVFAGNGTEKFEFVTHGLDGIKELNAR